MTEPRIRRLTAAPTFAALAVVTFTGCGGSDDNSPEAGTAASSSAAAGDLDSAQCTDPAFLVDNAEFCYGGGYVPADELDTIDLGSPYELVSLDDPESRETMTIRMAECGLTELENGAPNPAWDGSDDIPQTVTTTADSGMEFCRITASWQNTGKRPITGWTDFESLVTEDGTEYAEDTKAEQATQYINEYGMPSSCSPYLCSTINPGTPAFDVVKIYQVPAGTEPTAVRYPRATFDSGPVVQFALK
jgi:hypothetical protein